MQHNQNLEFNPITNYSQDIELEEYVLIGWKTVQNNEVPDHGPFTDIEGLNFSIESHKPKDFVNQLFEESMFTVMAQATNVYAHDKIRKFLQGKDQFEQMDHYTHKQHARLGTWKDLNMNKTLKLLLSISLS